MCGMTSFHVRLENSIHAPGKWFVFPSRNYNHGNVYMRVAEYVNWRDLSYGKPLYAIHIRARDWGVQA
jgi:hypothetical protein